MYKVKPLTAGTVLTMGNHVYTVPESGNYDVSVSYIRKSGYPDGVFDCRDYNEQDWLEALEHFEKTYPDAAAAMKKRNTKLYKALK